MEKHRKSSKRHKTSDSDTDSEKKNAINLKKHEKSRRQHDSEDSDYDIYEEKNMKKGLESSKPRRRHMHYEFDSDNEKKNKSRKPSAAHESHHFRRRKVAEEKTNDTNDESSDTDSGKETTGIQVVNTINLKRSKIQRLMVVEARALTVVVIQTMITAVVQRSRIGGRHARMIVKQRTRAPRSTDLLHKNKTSILGQTGGIITTMLEVAIKMVLTLLGENTSMPQRRLKKLSNLNQGEIGRTWMIMEAKKEGKGERLNMMAHLLVYKIQTLEMLV
ncbi:uncharacterized protein LOC103701437 [Phoenix dactylifera]|uniref:Uncharacterized protein LOC103701437 n=1 Tax=Phoenix dactylifera TaxID=42345 RepID=A0A8B9AJR2_PHODC|nr:uncharacterized protein LOC103701437 [Phoenix dactylifera]XP_038984262.1 uncharacterized protein LOC103701437 [Phoenix dactylifera]